MDRPTNMNTDLFTKFDQANWWIIQQLLRLLINHEVDLGIGESGTMSGAGAVQAMDYETYCGVAVYSWNMLTSFFCFFCIFFVKQLN